MDKDRISRLPDEILQVILSKVDAKGAVQTSILSKRWKSLWSSLLDLSFSFEQPADKNCASLEWLNYNARFMPRFTHFVIQFLSHRDDSSRIRKFQLSLSHTTGIDSGFVETCLDHAINHRVQHLDLDAYCHPTPLQFPAGLLACKSLRVLKLKQYSRSVVVPKPFVLSSLETLYLECFEFRDDGDPYSFPKEAFSSFPNLEELTLHRCGVSGLIISASKLRTLEISFRDALFAREKMIEKIATPRLVSFRCEGYVSLACSRVDFPCLEVVFFDISPILDSPYTEEIKKRMPLNTVRMLQQFGNAKFVTLTLSTIEVLEMDLHLLEQSPSPFPRIKCLNLTKRPHVIHPTTTKTVPRAVMNYLTKGSSYGDSLVVKFTEGIKV